MVIQLIKSKIKQIARLSISKSQNYNCSEQILEGLEVELAKVPGTKVVQKCQIYIFALGRIITTVKKLGEKCTARFRLGNITTAKNVSRGG